jgi:hypothetical protein
MLDTGADFHTCSVGYEVSGSGNLDMGYGMMDFSALRTPMLLWQQIAHMAVEAQMVIVFRTAGMMGVLRQDLIEPQRMVLEKADAASEAIQAALRAAGRGEGVDQMMAAALRPYRRRTRANMRRLSRKA